MSMENSNINKSSAMRILQGPFGQELLNAFLEIEQTMKNRAGGSNFFGQIGFTEPGDPIMEGDFIPTIHLSLQPFQPVMSEPIQIIPEEGD